MLKLVARESFSYYWSVVGKQYAHVSSYGVPEVKTEE